MTPYFFVVHVCWSEVVDLKSLTTRPCEWMPKAKYTDLGPNVLDKGPITFKAIVEWGRSAVQCMQLVDRFYFGIRN